MRLNSCRLDIEGEKARDDLLNLLYPGKSYTKTQLEMDTDLGRGETIPKILGEIKKGGIQLKKINKFFERLLKKTIKDHKDYIFIEQSTIDDYLQKYELVQFYQEILSTDFDLPVPRKFYCCSSKVPESKSYFKRKLTSQLIAKPSELRNKNSKIDVEDREKQTSDAGSIVNLFWNLDYEQGKEFTGALANKPKFISCSITAPCDITQRWILNRLMRHIPNVDNALIISIDLSRNPMRHKFSLFWKELSQYLGVDPLKDDVIRELCYKDVAVPIILKICNFQDEQNIQRKIVEDFWEIVTQKIDNDSRRTEDSHLILFFVDQCSPDCNSTQVIKLDPLIDISGVDVRSWLYNPLVYNWWKPQFGSDFANDLISECFGNENIIVSNPRSILDRICLKFGLENGVIEIEELWQW